jgi:phosphate:Na+ symporter
LAHIFYCVGIGIIGLVLLRPLVAAAEWVGARLDDPDGVLALAAFSSIFKLVGVAAFFPWLDRFSQLIVAISGKGNEGALARLEPALAAAGGPVALEAAWRAILELARGSIEAVRRRLAGDPVAYDPPIEAVRRIEEFLQSLSLETLDLGAFEPRLVRLVHALDHLARLNEDLQRAPPAAAGWQPPSGFAAGAQALGDWLEATTDPDAAGDTDPNAALEAAATRLAAERQTGRAAMLEDVAMQRLPTATARAALDLLGWADGVLHHAWRFAALLREAAGARPAGVLIGERG